MAIWNNGIRPSPELKGQLPSETTAAASVPVWSTPTAPPPETQDLQVKQVDTGLKVSFSSRLMFLPGQAVLEPRAAKSWIS